MRTVHMNFDEFVPDTKEGLISGSCGLFEDMIHDTILDPAWTGDDDGPKRSRSVRDYSQECGVDCVVKSGQSLLVCG